MKVVQINGGVFGSTGKIMFGIAETLKKNGGKVMCFSPVTTTNRNKNPQHKYNKIGSFRSRQINVLFSRFSGYEGCFSFFSTNKMIKQISRFNPDIIHLHNIHGGFINLPMLFNYIKKNKIKTVWTLHDCWSFTGHCPYFDIPNCSKWKNRCVGCPVYREYPESMFDNSKKMHRLKKKWFSGLPDCKIITPSLWLANLAEQSFLRQYDIRTINNGIDLEVFKPSESGIREKYNLNNKFLILGVSFVWGKRKGLDVFSELAKKLSDDYKIILVGTDENVESQLPDNVLTIRRTQNQTELAQLYTAADVFVNPTREDNFPTVNIEALACGTPVVTFNTGGSPEIIDTTCGSVIGDNSAESLMAEIENIYNNPRFLPFNCINKAKQYNQEDKFFEYVKLYKEILDERTPEG